VSSQNIKKLIAGGASVVVLASALAACGSSGGSSNKTGGGSGSVTKVGQGARLTGTYSAADFWAWVPNGMYPSSITESPDGSYTTGSVVKADAKYQWPSLSCDQALQESGGPGFGEEAYGLDQGQNSSQTEDFAYGYYLFPSAADATAFVQAAGAKYSGCGSFTSTDSGSSVPVTLSVGSAPDVPAANATVDLRQAATVNGKQVVAEFVVSADGNMVVYAESAGNGSLPAEVSNATVVQKILTAFAAGEASDVANHVPSDYTTSGASSGSTDPSADDAMSGTVAWAGEIR
jgi:hypothetical protein